MLEKNDKSAIFFLLTICIAILDYTLKDDVALFVDNTCLIAETIYCAALMFTYKNIYVTQVSIAFTNHLKKYIIDHFLSN